MKKGKFKDNLWSPGVHLKEVLFHRKAEMELEGAAYDNLNGLPGT